MEIWDVLDAGGNKTGKTIARNENNTLTDSEYVLAVHVYIQNQKNRWLIQKRSATKEFAPNVWDITGGAVISGEDSQSAALREVKEEIGIDLDQNNMYLEARLTRESRFVDIWVARASFDLSACVLQAEEVSAVRWVASEDLMNLVFHGEYRDRDYEALVTELVNTYNQEGSQ